MFGIVRLLILLAIVAAAALAARAIMRPAATPLDLGAPVGPLSGRRLTAIAGDAAACRRALARAGVRFAALPDTDTGVCGPRSAVRAESAGSWTLRFAPRDMAASCGVTAALAAWDWQVVQPAAYRRFGQGVTTIAHFGTYSCRRINGRGSGDWSEHAHANAIDVAGFRLADGHEIGVARDWRGTSPEAAFLRDVRDGACGLFATVLSPDYNRAHHDHLHLDQAARGSAGWRACR